MERWVCHREVGIKMRTCLRNELMPTNESFPCPVALMVSGSSFTYYRKLFIFLFFFFYGTVKCKVSNCLVYRANRPVVCVCLIVYEL